MTRNICFTMVLAAIGLTLNLSSANAAVHTVDCAKDQSIQRVIDTALSSAAPLEIYFSGTCEENLRITRDRLILDGNNEGTISGLVSIFTAAVTLRDLAVTGPGPGVRVFGGRSRLLGVNLYGNEGDGLLITQNAMVVLNGSTVSSNGVSGVFVQAGTLYATNTGIVGNNLNGILAEIGSRVFLDGTWIEDNSSIGLYLSLHSAADLRNGARITGNLGYGAFAGQDSGIRTATPDVVINDPVYCEDLESSFVSAGSIAGPVLCSDFNW